MELDKEGLTTAPRRSYSRLSEITKAFRTGLGGFRDIFDDNGREDNIFLDNEREEREKEKETEIERLRERIGGGCEPFTSEKVNVVVRCAIVQFSHRN